MQVQLSFFLFFSASDPSQMLIGDTTIHSTRVLGLLARGHCIHVVPNSVRSEIFQSLSWYLAQYPNKRPFQSSRHNLYRTSSIQSLTNCHLCEVRVGVFARNPSSWLWSQPETPKTKCCCFVHCKKYRRDPSACWVPDFSGTWPCFLSFQWGMRSEGWGFEVNIVYYIVSLFINTYDLRICSFCSAWILSCTYNSRHDRSCSSISQYTGISGVSNSPKLPASAASAVVSSASPL